jgi:hypothetical protein
MDTCKHNHTHTGNESRRKSIPVTRDVPSSGVEREKIVLLIVFGARAYDPQHASL